MSVADPAPRQERTVPPPECTGALSVAPAARRRGRAVREDPFGAALRTAPP